MVVNQSSSDPIEIPSGNGQQNSNSNSQGHRQTASFSQNSLSAASMGSINSVRPPIVKEFSLNGWSFESVRSSISSATQIESYNNKDLQEYALILL